MSTQTKSLILNSFCPDIWAIVFDELLYSNSANDEDENWSGWSEPTPSTTLTPLSLTCKALRQSILPWLFYDIRCTSPKFIPSHLWKYVRILRLNDRWRTGGKYSEWRNEFHEAISRFPYLRTVHLKLVGVSPALFHSLSKSLTLTTIILDTYPYLTEARCSLPSFPALRHFVYVRPFRSYPSVSSDCRTFLSHLIQSSLCSFVHLDVPIFVLPADIPNKKATSLEALKLRGKFSQSQPIWHVIQACPSLRELEIDVVPDSSSHPYAFTIFPLHGTTLSDGQISDSLRNLRRLTITHPDPSDRIFSNLPYELEYLSIPGVKFQNKGSDILPNKDMLIHMLSQCSTRHLKELQFSVLEDLSAELLFVIQDRFQELKILEIRQRYCLSQVRKMTSGGDLNSNLNDIVEAIDGFEKLVKLRLNLYIEWSLFEMNLMVQMLGRRSPSLVNVWFRKPRPGRNIYGRWHEHVIDRNSRHLEKEMAILENSEKIAPVRIVHEPDFEKQRIGIS